MRFDEQADAWLGPDDSALEASADALAVATYNVWFGSHCFDERLAVMSRILAGTDADFIGLQEVTPPFRDALLAEPWVRRQYAVSDPAGDSVDPYGALLLARPPVERFVITPLPTTMGRRLVHAETSIAGRRLIVGTVHLESLRMAPVREQQLRLIFDVLSEADDAILMGDFNFDPSWPEQQCLQPTYRDAWVYVHGDEPGPTIDCQANRMRAQLGRAEDAVRFDRVIVRSHRWRPAAIHRLGTNPIAAELADVFPSDHFGLHAQLQRPGSARHA
jgi:tyrosyl-DNA phosphodiesterase 2